jgi:hypothetical protein
MKLKRLPGIENFTGGPLNPRQGRLHETTQMLSTACCAGSSRNRPVGRQERAGRDDGFSEAQGGPAKGSPVFARSKRARTSPRGVTN